MKSKKSHTTVVIELKIKNGCRYVTLDEIKKTMDRVEKAELLSRKTSTKKRK